MAKTRDPNPSVLTTPAPVIQNDRTDGNGCNLRMAVERLVQLFNQAETECLYGTVGVEITFERGRANIVRRILNGTDKP